MPSRKPKYTMASYIYKVLKQVHPDVGMSGKAMDILLDVNSDFTQRICKQAVALAQVNGNRTVNAQAVQTAVRLLLPGELPSAVCSLHHRRFDCPRCFEYPHHS